MTTSTSFVRVESGIQLLARLTKKGNIENIYPPLFETGPKPGEVIELYSKGDMSCLLKELIYEVLIGKRNDQGSGVLLFNTDGNISFDSLLNVVVKKCTNYNSQIGSDNDDVHDLLKTLLDKFYVVNIQDALQLYTTLYALEDILTEHPDISLIIIDTLTAFYWSEQEPKIVKMDMYIKHLLLKFQKVTKEYKINILYTRPDYFSSSKDNIENLEACCEYPTLERLNYRIQLEEKDNGTHTVHVKSYNKQIKNIFIVENGQIKWM